MPNVYTFGLQYDYSEEAISKDDLKKLFKIIPPTVNLKDFLRVGEKKTENCNYVLRGMITFYGRHYISYFYSDKYDTWMQFDDEHIKSIGNFKAVMKKCISGRQQPTTLFYE